MANPTNQLARAAIITALQRYFVGADDYDLTIQKLRALESPRWLRYAIAEHSQLNDGSKDRND